MSSRYGGGHLHQRDARSQLFDNNNNNSGSGYGYGYGYPGGSSSSDGRSPRVASAYRPATPNARGQYSASVLEELESQNDAQVEGLSAKVKMLKDITEAIGEEVRSSSTLVASMNDSFDSTRAKLQGTMSNMMRMARRTGVGWKAWLLFTCAVVFMFWYVWLF